MSLAHEHAPEPPNISAAGVPSVTNGTPQPSSHSPATLESPHPALTPTSPRRTSHVNTINGIQSTHSPRSRRQSQATSVSSGSIHSLSGRRKRGTSTDRAVFSFDADDFQALDLLGEGPRLTPEQERRIDLFHTKCDGYMLEDIDKAKKIVATLDHVDLRLDYAEVAAEVYVREIARRTQQDGLLSEDTKRDVAQNLFTALKGQHTYQEIISLTAQSDFYYLFTIWRQVCDEKGIPYHYILVIGQKEDEASTDPQSPTLPTDDSANPSTPVPTPQETSNCAQPTLPPFTVNHPSAGTIEYVAPSRLPLTVVVKACVDGMEGWGLVKKKERRNTATTVPRVVWAATSSQCDCSITLTLLMASRLDSVLQLRVQAHSRLLSLARGLSKDQDRLLESVAERLEDIMRTSLADTGV